jgi:hypothetical protein
VAIASKSWISGDSARSPPWQAAARARKPEYPLEFLYKNRTAYLGVADLLGHITVIRPMPVHDVEAEVIAHAVKKLSYEAAEIPRDPLAVQR